jgi:GYF domain 2
MPTPKGSSKRPRWYYSNQGHDVAGPCTQAQLKKLAAEGQLRPNDFVGKNRAVHLIKAGRVKGLFPAG